MESYRTILSAELNPESFVRQALRLLETDFRHIALLALADWERLDLVSPSLFNAIAGVQRPSWGTWNGLIDALRNARKSLLHAASDLERQELKKAGTLLSVLELFDTRIDEPTTSALEPLAAFCRVHLEERPRVRRVLILPITVRNRIAHDVPTEASWWEKAAVALKPLIQFYAHSNLRQLVERADMCPTPWFLNEEGQIWSFNGLENDGSAIYVSQNGETQYSSERSQAVLLSFQRLLGKADIQESDFRQLLFSIAPEEVKGVLMGDYLVGRPIGAGGFATVHVGRQLSTGRKVAIKLLRDGMSEDVKVRFRQEARYLSRLSHPHIVNVYGYGEEPWSAPRPVSLDNEEWFSDFSKSAPIKSYIALEWVDGRTLESVFCAVQKRPSIRSLTVFFAEAAHALDAVHNAGLIHRDIKPSNLMITQDNHVKVMDFGVARTQEDVRTLITATGRIFGTPAYMSPEQLRAADADAEVGPRTDIYSLCGAFYELYTGRRLYNHDTEAPDTVKRHKLNGERPERPTACAPGLPWELETIVLGGLEPEPSDRYATMADLERDLRHFLADESIEYRRPSLARRFQLGYRRNRVVLNLLAFFFFLACCGIALYVRGVNVERRNAEEHRDRANEEACIANAERARAEHNFALARETVDRFFTRVSEEELLQVDGMQPLRKRLLEDALTYYQGFLKQQGDDREVLAAVASAHERVGEIHDLIGKKETSIQAFRNASSIWKTLLKQDPTSIELRDQLSGSLWTLAIVQRQVGQVSQALESMESSIAIIEQIARENPDDLGRQIFLTESYANLAPLLRAAGEYEKAEEIYELAWTTLKERLTKYPRLGVKLGTPSEQSGQPSGDNVVRSVDAGSGAATAGVKPNDIVVAFGGQDILTSEDLRNALLHYKAGDVVKMCVIRGYEEVAFDVELGKRHNIHLGNVALNAGILAHEVYNDYTKALRWYEMAVEQFEGSRSDVYTRETELLWENMMYRAYAYIASLHISMGNAEQGLQFTEKAHSIAETIAQNNPAVTDYRSALAMSKFNLGALYLSSERAKARQLFEQARAIFEEIVAANPGVFRSELQLAEAYAQIGAMASEDSELHDALQCYVRAKDILVGLLSRDVEVAEKGEILARLSEAHTQIAMTCENLGDAGRSTVAHEQRVSILNQLIEFLNRDELSTQQRDLLRTKAALALNNVGTYCLDADKRVLAREDFGRILSILDSAHLSESQSDSDTDLIARAYGNLAWIDLLEEDFAESREKSTRGLKIDPTQSWIRQNLAHAHLFDGQYEAAKALYVELKNSSSDKVGFLKQLSDDFRYLQERGITHADTEKIESLLQE